MAETPQAAAPSGPPAPSPVAIAWCLVAGSFLLLAPAEPHLWGRVVDAHESLGRFADARAVRHAVSAFGLIVLLVGVRDLVSLVVRRASG